MRGAADGRRAGERTTVMTGATPARRAGAGRVKRRGRLVGPHDGRASDGVTLSRTWSPIRGRRRRMTVDGARHADGSKWRWSITLRTWEPTTWSWGWRDGQRGREFDEEKSGQRSGTATRRRAKRRESSRLLVRRTCGGWETPDRGRSQREPCVVTSWIAHQLIS